MGTAGASACNPADDAGQRRAPAKEYVVFERSGHTPPYDEPGRFADYLQHVRERVGEQSR